jgi:hypothetical protein
MHGAWAWGGLPGRDVRTASRSALRAWSRCHPVRAQFIQDLPLRALGAIRYLVAISSVTALLSPVVSPTRCLLPPWTPGGKQARYAGILR